MKKIVVLATSLLLFSCGTTSSKLVSEKKPLFELLEQETYGGAGIRFFEILSEPNEIRMLQNDENLKKKISATDVQNSNFIVLNMGEKPSEGYKITIATAVETDANIIITVKETAPEPSAMVSQVITNPFSVVKINSKKAIIIK